MVQDFQFKCSLEECNHLYALRDIGHCSEGLLEANTDPRLNKAFDITYQDGDKYLGSCSVPASNLILQSATAGAMILRNYLTGKHDQPNLPDDEMLQTQYSNSAISNSSDIEGEKHESEDWDIFREESIPSCVKTVQFIIHDDEATAETRKNLVARFPGVVILGESNQLQAENKAKDIPEQPMLGTSGLAVPKEIEIEEECFKRLSKIFFHWERHGRIPPCEQRTNSKRRSPLTLSRNPLQQFYGDLIVLYKIAYHNQNEALARGDQVSANKASELANAVLLRFQLSVFDFPEAVDFPHLRIVAQAFEYLPSDCALCRFIIILFSFLWKTDGEGDFDKFTRENRDIDQTALSKLVYGIAFYRCSLTEGHDAAVFERWCEAHEHDDNSPDRLCAESQLEIKTRRVDAFERENVRKKEDAENLIRDLGGTYSYKKSKDTKPPKSASRGPKTASKPVLKAAKFVQAPITPSNVRTSIESYSGSRTSGTTGGRITRQSTIAPGSLIHQTVEPNTPISSVGPQAEEDESSNDEDGRPIDPLARFKERAARNGVQPGQKQDAQRRAASARLTGSGSYRSNLTTETPPATVSTTGRRSSIRSTVENNQPEEDDEDTPVRRNQRKRAPLDGLDDQSPKRKRLSTIA